MKSRSLRVFLLAVAVSAGAGRLPACGPDFPNTLLDGGDAAVLVAPVANFEAELRRMKLAPGKFTALPPKANDYASQTTAADLADLRAALDAGGMEAEKRDRIVEAYGAQRLKLQKESQATNASERSEERAGENGELKPSQPPPQWSDIKVVEGLPGEFADYFLGCIAYHHSDTNAARESWQRLLARPASERHYHSTWAAYMLGQLCSTEESAGAVDFYQQVRALAGDGFADSLGLAAASLGWEAHTCLNQKEFEPAIELYLQQFTAGDPSAANSLRFAAAAALQGEPETLAALAQNPRVRRVITSFIIARDLRQSGMREGTQQIVKRWLEAIEAAGIKDVESAETLALAAYQTGQMELAQSWIDRAADSPVAQWLHAKLLLRAGEVQPAAALLARLAQGFPVQPPATNDFIPASLAESLTTDERLGDPNQGAPANRILGELGVLRRARHDYLLSLDALLRSGYWFDAAYVAERVLTVDELKLYVDRLWPQAADGAETTTPKKYAYYSPDALLTPQLQRVAVRWLLGRRLARAARLDEAGAYFPAEYKTPFDFWVHALGTGRDDTLPRDVRAAALFEAAKIARHDGLELLGTEVAPDWRVVDGDYQLGLTAPVPATSADFKPLGPGAEELSRYAANHPEPDIRFHYRYRAAALAMQAAELLPNNSDATARILCTAGSWLKNRDPKAADVFYKALVRRCRKTAIGAEADRLRWFPQLDEQGNLVKIGADQEKQPH